MKFTICHKVEGEMNHVNQHFNKELFQFLKPPMMDLEIVTYNGHKPGEKLHIKVGMFGMMQNWIGEIDAARTTQQFNIFRDVGSILPFPLTKWQHVHGLKKIDDKHTLIIDRISFECKNKFITALFSPILYVMFRMRRNKYQKYFRLRM